MHRMVRILTVCFNEYIILKLKVVWKIRSTILLTCGLLLVGATVHGPNPSISLVFHCSYLLLSYPFLLFPFHGSWLSNNHKIEIPIQCLLDSLMVEADTNSIASGKGEGAKPDVFCALFFSWIWLVYLTFVMNSCFLDKTAALS